MKARWRSEPLSDSSGHSRPGLDSRRQGGSSHELDGAALAARDQNLLLALAGARRREIAVCQALGAGRFRIVRRQLAEGLVLALSAGAAGLLLAAWLTSLFDGMRILTFMPAVAGVGIDWRVCAFTMATAALTGVLFSIAPAIASTRVDLHSSLKDGPTSTSRGRRVLGGILVTAQVAASVTLLVGAGLFIRTLDKIRALDLGLSADGVVSLSVDPSRQGYTPDRSQQYFSDFLDRLRRSPGIEHAAFSWTTPYGGARSELAFTLPEAPARTLTAASNQISPGYFATMRIPILAGRDFTDAECRRAAAAVGVTIVSQRFVREHFPDGGALGSRLAVNDPRPMELEVVGIVGDVRGRPITDEPEPYAYEPVGQREPSMWGTVQVRSALPLAQTVATIRGTARAIDASLPAYDIEPFGAAIDRALSEQRLFARLSGAFAAIAALVAIAAVASVVPALRAARVDPVTSLRVD